MRLQYNIITDQLLVVTGLSSGYLTAVNRTVDIDYHI